MKPRKLTLESGIWRYLVGNMATTLWKPSGKKLRILNWYIGGRTPEGHFCFDEHCTAKGLPVTPGKLRKYIEENLEG